MRKFISRSPLTKEVFKEFEFITDSQLQTHLLQSSLGFSVQKKQSNSQKSAKLLKLSNLIDQNQDKYADLITAEMGKPKSQALAEVKKSSNHCRFMSENLENIFKSERIKTEAKKSIILYQPLGTIYMISPFNFPFWLIFKGIIPILAAGNSALVRVSDSTPLTGLAAEELFQKAGFDSYEYQNVFTSPSQLEQICASKFVGGVAFTGSTQAGSHIAQMASKYIKKTTMELGGNDAFIVLNDADIDLAVELACKSRLMNAGQVCISAKRFIIIENVYDQFVEKLINKLKNIRIGDPFDLNTELGPIAREDLLENLLIQISKSIQQGGKLLYGGEKLHLKQFENSNFFTPAVLEVNSDNIANNEEIFGPVFSLFKVANSKDAVKLANESQYGLAGCVISKDIKKAEEICEELECGSTFVNDFAKSDSRLPMGGIKNSGYGRECGKMGALEFTNIKTLSIS